MSIFSYILNFSSTILLLHVLNLNVEDWRDGETAQWLKTLAALPEDPDPIPITHMRAHTCL